MNNNLENLKEELNFMRFKKAFLLAFTRQLIIHSSHADMLKLQTILEKEETQRPLTQKEKIKEKIRRREESQDEIIEGTRSIMHPAVGMFETQSTPEINPFANTFKKESPSEPLKKIYKAEQVKETPIRAIRPQQIQDPFRKIELWIPEPNLPPHIQYLRPTPVVNKSIELGKLIPLVNDSMVKIIECYGPNENIGVKGNMGAKKTAIVLSKEEIDEVIQKFSKETKIPVQEGIYKVVSGRLILLAVISSVAGTKFTITKMPQEQMNQKM